MLAGNAERDRAADVLKAAYAEGRLTKEEYDHRVGRAVAARSVEELQQLTADVPNGPAALPPSGPAPYRPGWSQPYAGGPAGLRVPYGPPRRNAAATGALVCGLVGPLTCGITGIPALLLGYRARREIRASGELGDGVAVAGITLGWIMLAGLVLVFLGAVF